jgi:hypothetical protein
MQLTRIRGGSANSSAFKKRTELLNSFDTLSSHFATTFSALSTALARSTPPDRTFGDRETEIQPEVHHGQNARRKACAYLAILVGPSAASAKARVMFAVDGLEVKVWGERDDREVDGLSEEDSDSEGGTDESEDSSGEEEGEQDSSGDKDAEGSDANSSERPPSLFPISSPPSSHRHRTALISPVLSYAEEQQAFRTAERLLSRTLATADGEGHSMASEMGTSVPHPPCTF